MTQAQGKKPQGTCGYCRRRFLTQEGRLSAHGFRVSNGWKNWLGYRDGSCPAAKMLALELSPETLDLLIEHVKLAVKNHKAALATLRARPAKLVVTVNMGHWGAVPDFRAFEFHCGDLTGQSVPMRGYMTYETVLERDTAEREYQLSMAKSALADAVRRRSEWAATELRMVAAR